MAKKKGSKVLKWVAIGAAALIAIGGVTALLGANDDEKTVSAFAWERSAVDEKGRIYESDAAIVTDYISANELSIEYGKDAEFTYRVHLYNEDKEYVETTLDLTTDYEYKAATGSTIVYAVVEVDVPKDDEDGKISLIEKFEYANQLTITYNPELIEIKAAEGSTEAES